MNLRLLPWAAMALLVLALAVRSALPTNVVAVPAGAPGPERGTTVATVMAPSLSPGCGSSPSRRM